jgi:hypothetical protein
MKLSEATQLLESHGRDFSEIYKLYNFKDDADLKDYLDFIVHEPVEWMKGFPARWVTKGSFGRPKTALVKLLKLDKVREEYTESYTQRIYDCVWSTFKKHADDILSHRNMIQKNTIIPDNGSGIRSSRGSVVDLGGIAEEFENGNGTGSPMRNRIISNDEYENGTIDEAESVHSVKIIRALAASAVRAGSDTKLVKEDDSVWMRRYKVLETAYRALLVHFGDKGLVASTSILLDALSYGDSV